MRERKGKSAAPAGGAHLNFLQRRRGAHLRMAPRACRATLRGKRATAMQETAMRPAGATVGRLITDKSVLIICACFGGAHPAAGGQEVRLACVWEGRHGRHGRLRQGVGVPPASRRVLARRAKTEGRLSRKAKTSVAAGRARWRASSRDTGSSRATGLYPSVELRTKVTVCRGAASRPNRAMGCGALSLSKRSRAMGRSIASPSTPLGALSLSNGQAGSSRFRHQTERPCSARAGRGLAPAT